LMRIASIASSSLQHWQHWNKCHTLSNCDFASKFQITNLTCTIVHWSSGQCDLHSLIFCSD
jgi:hypothetical protein